MQAVYQIGPTSVIDKSVYVLTSRTQEYGDNHASRVQWTIPLAV